MFGFRLGDDGKVEMSAYSGRSEITPVRCDWVVERDGFEPEVSLAVLPTTQSETPVPKIGHSDFGPGDDFHP